MLLSIVAFQKRFLGSFMDVELGIENFVLGGNVFPNEVDQGGKEILHLLLS